VILLRKKLYTQATKNLEKASRLWDGEPEELAQASVKLLFFIFPLFSVTPDHFGPGEFPVAHNLVPPLHFACNKNVTYWPTLLRRVWERCPSSFRSR
jgi:hypothetical protein